MSEFTYSPPDEKLFLQALKTKVKNDDMLSSILNKVRHITIDSTGQYSRRRWNEYIGSISLCVGLSEIEDMDDKIHGRILEICNSLMPSNCGIYLEEVNIVPDYGDSLTNFIEDALTSEDELIQSSISINISDEVIEKGKDLSHVYNLLFIIENTLREYIERKLSEKFGENCYEQATIPIAVRNTVSTRMEQEKLNKWIRVRSESWIYYLDFIELGYIIKNNWPIFQKYFPSQEWIMVKMDELYKCRNLIAHNSSIGSHEIDVLKINFQSILKQIGNLNQ